MSDTNSNTANVTTAEDEYVDAATGETVKVKTVFVASPTLTSEQMDLAVDAAGLRARVEALALARQHIDHYTTIPTPYDDVIEAARRKDSEVIGDPDVINKVADALMQREQARAEIKVVVAQTYLDFILATTEGTN